MIKLILRIYLVCAIIVPTVAIIACFKWYTVEYSMAVNLYPSQKERSEIHRNNALWLGLWGGIYGIISTTATGFLLLDIQLSKTKKQSENNQSLPVPNELVAKRE